MKKTVKIENTMSEQKLEELKHNASEILAYCRQSLLNKHPFVGSVALTLDLKPVRDIRCDTAMTDGNNIFFDIDFLSRLNQDEREFVLGHEVWHVVMMHFLRGEGKEHQMFNIATDMEVNQLLAKDGFVAPQDVLFPNKNFNRKTMFDFPSDLSAEEYYDLLMNKMENKEGGNSGESKSNSSNGKSGNGNSKNPCKGQFDDHFDKNKDYSQEQAEKELKEAISDKYGVKGFDKDFTPSSFKNEPDERNVSNKVRESVIGAAQQVERSRGTLPDYVKKIVNSLLEPKMPWKELLAAFVTSSFYNKTNWNRPNRRFAYSGTYLPSHDGEMMRIAVGIDTSGSCQGDCERFLTEVASIAKSFSSYELHIIQCDTEVKDYQVFDESNPLDPEHNGIEFKGFGGTELRPIFNYINDKELEVDAVVMFTDGECETFEDDGSIELPVLWTIVGSNENKPNLKVGTQVFIDSSKD